MAAEQNIDAERAFEAWAKETYEPRLGKDWKCVTWSINHGDKALAAFKGGIEYVRRSAAIGEVGLPELPAAEIPAYGDAAAFYTADQVRQYAHDAVAADRRARASIDGQLTKAPSPVKQAAQGVKTWQERMSDATFDRVRNRECTASEKAMLAEITDLRAQLAHQSDAVESVIACARRVHAKFGADSDWSEWRDLGDALAELVAAPPLSSEQQATRVIDLLREARATLEMWKDVAPAVSLCADIDRVLAGEQQAEKGEK
jgi:hypothetical protein